VTYIDGGLPQYGGEGAGATEIVFQWWENGKSVIDLEPFDKVVRAAEKTGIKLIVALTNNWADYGGMDVYTVNLGGQYHDDVRDRFPPLLVSWLCWLVGSEGERVEC
jgi:mannan endo-1,4-beta-mannosidase